MFLAYEVKLSFLNCNPIQKKSIQLIFFMSLIFKVTVTFGILVEIQ